MNTSRSLRILADYHHSGAARAQVLTLQHRLKHQVFFGNAKFTDSLRREYGVDSSLWLPCLPSWLIGMGGVPDDMLMPDKSWPNLIGWEDFFNTQWDAVLCTRIESQDIFKRMIHEHNHGKDIKVIGVTGNDATPFDWSFIKNLMTSDEATYRLSPWDINKIHYSQEMGMQYDTKFVPITESTLRTINSFVNCWRDFTYQWVWSYDSNLNRGRCPHCDQPPPQDRLPAPVSPYGIWEEAARRLPGHTFNDYGINCKMGCKPEVQLPLEYSQGSLTVHMKNYDGYGFSMLQSIACGRPVIVPYRFHRYRTAGKYLIPNLTCFESEWSGENLAHIIGYVTENLDRANEYAYACWKASKGLFQWDHEAYRLSEFMGRLI